MAEFSPAQLDALEDALEDLELAGIPSELEDDVGVTDRLSDYKDLLALSREALPVVDVPDGILASVLAEAHAAPQAVEPAVAAADETPWWKRLGVWIPMLAVGASAALMLVMVRGTLSSDEAPATVASANGGGEKDAAKADDAAAVRKPGGLLEQPEALQAAAESAKDADDVRREALEGEARGRLRGSAAGDSALGGGAPASAAAADEEAPAEPEPEPEPEAAAKSETADKVVYDDAPAPATRKAKPKSAPSKKSSGGKKNRGPLPKGSALPGGVPSLPRTEPADEKKKADAPDPAKLLSSAHANRRAGRCGTARSQYGTLTDVSDASIRARALAGLGLCALAGGDEKAAESFFARARKADSSVSGYIESQRASAAPTQQSKSKKKK
ncbi:MAG: hypothetical protein AAGA54_21800 [Myxococcota bacterium]